MTIPLTFKRNIVVHTISCFFAVQYISCRAEVHLALEQQSTLQISNPKLWNHARLHLEQCSDLN